MANPLCYALGSPALNALGLLASLAIPRFLAPQQFGAYSLLLDLCRYAMRTDLGLTQLADRRLAAGLDSTRSDEAERILAARWHIGCVALAILTPLTVLIAALTAKLSPLDATLAVSGGVLAMMAGGPASIYRARGDIWMYTGLSFVFGVGFVVPRLLGVIIGGTTGCFAFLLCWYALIAGAFWFRAPRIAQRKVATLGMIIAAMPMFVFSAAWTQYLSAARWIAAFLTTPSDLGLFALGANLVFTGVFTVGMLADVRYPVWLARLAKSGERELSVAIAREAFFVALPLAVAVAALLPATPRLVALLFPEYIGAESLLSGLAFAGVPLGVFAWFLPIMIARSARPLWDAVIVFVPANATLLLAMVVGERYLGIEGLALGSCVSGLVALAAMAFVLERSRVLGLITAIAFVLCPMTSLILPGASLLAVHELRVAPLASVQKHVVKQTTGRRRQT